MEIEIEEEKAVNSRPMKPSKAGEESKLQADRLESEHFFPTNPFIDHFLKKIFQSTYYQFSQEFVPQKSAEVPHETMNEVITRTVT